VGWTETFARFWCFLVVLVSKFIMSSDDCKPSDKFYRLITIQKKLGLLKRRKKAAAEKVEITHYHGYERDKNGDDVTRSFSNRKCQCL